MTGIITGAVILFAVGITLGIALERKATRHTEHDLNQETWERIEGWRK